MWMCMNRILSIPCTFMDKTINGVLIAVRQHWHTWKYSASSVSNFTKINKQRYFNIGNELIMYIRNTHYSYGTITISVSKRLY